MVPTCAVEHHDDVLLGVATCSLCKKQCHACTIDCWQHQAVRPAIHRADSGIRVDVLVREHGLDRWTQWVWSPAVTAVADAAKARLVLEHQPQGL